MQVLIRPSAAKYIERLSSTDKERIKLALDELSNEPPVTNVVPRGQAYKKKNRRKK